MPPGERPRMTPPRRASQATKKTRADSLLAAELGAVAFLLGCYELFDPDIWWHLKSGQWILEHGRVPFLDIFTFSSSDRVWVDLHWGFQVALALAFRLAGVAGMIVMAAAAGSAAVSIAMTARGPLWPRWAAVLCWLPALALMAMRFDPRPEMFSLVYLACFLAILVRVEQRPTLAWCLPPVQVLWVNTHGLFVLGPIVLGCYIVERVAQVWIDSRALGEGPAQRSRLLWRHLILVLAAVAIACMVNPYGVRGALFPLELFPKISDPANPYKAYVDEFTNLHLVVRDQIRGSVAAHPQIRAHIFLLMLLPISFVLPAAWNKWRSSFGESQGVRGVGETAWTGGLVVACSLAMAFVLGLSMPATPGWLVSISRAVPTITLSLGACAALRLAVRSRVLSATLFAGSAAVAAWMAWLSAYLFDDGAAGYGLNIGTLGYLVAGFAAVSVVLVIRAGASIFRLLLAATFTYLSFQAIRNTNLFGLVAGAVLAWNVSEWLAELAAGRAHRIPSWVAPGVVAAFIALWSVGVVTDRYYALTGDTTHFGLHSARSPSRTRPCDSLADRAAARALVFDLGQTGVYLYHNGPERKVFMDARLELPSLATFQTYVRIEQWLNQNDSRWDAAIARLGDPLVLIGHDGWAEAEAALLTHPRWRCLYFDEIASIFVTRTGPSSSPEFADHDFAASHFAGGAKRSHPLIGETRLPK